MAVPSQLEAGTSEAGDSAFLEHSYLTYIIPHDTEIDITQYIQTAVAEKKVLEELESRTWLFFGMKPSALVRP